MLSCLIPKETDMKLMRMPMTMLQQRYFRPSYKRRKSTRIKKRDMWVYRIQTQLWSRHGERLRKGWPLLAENDPTYREDTDEELEREEY
jgi:hypothetical protein